MKQQHIGKRIKERRLQLRLSQEQLAERLGYKSRSAINKIEKGTNDVAQSKIPAYANALNTTIEYLLGIVDDPNRYSLNDGDLIYQDSYQTYRLNNEREKDLLDMYRDLNDKTKEKVFDYLTDQWKLFMFGNN